MKIIIIQAQGKDEKMMELADTSSYLVTWLAKLQSKNENNLIRPQNKRNYQEHLKYVFLPAVFKNKAYSEYIFCFGYINYK